jgi:uncharacterized membrane protein YeaQ/YmgE (transglycosylase-associated protein family)
MVLSSPVALLTAAALVGWLAARRVQHQPVDRLLDLMRALLGGAVGSATYILATQPATGQAEVVVAGLLGAWLTVGIVHVLQHGHRHP